MGITEEISNYLKTFSYVRCKFNNQIFIITDNKSLINNFDEVTFLVDEYKKVDNLDKAIEIKKMFQKYFGYVEVKKI